MKKMGQYNKAEQLFEAYGAVNKDVSNYMVLGCNYAKDLLMEEPKYDIALSPLSSHAADYGPAVFKDQIMFSSFRMIFVRSNDKVNKSIVNSRGAQLFKGAIRY